MQDMQEDVNCVLFALKSAAQLGSPAEMQARLRRIANADVPLMEELQDMLASMQVADTAQK